MISMRENVSDIGITPGLCLGLPAMAGVRSKRGAVQPALLGGLEGTRHASAGGWTHGRA
jgi:hypothetical protein